MDDRRPGSAGLAGAGPTIARIMAEHNVPGLSIAVTDSTGLLQAEGFGSRDLAAGLPATPRTSYPWFSMSKIATATAAMRLSDEGRLDLGAPVDAFVPSFRARTGQEPVVRQLLDHTSGAPNPLPVRWVLPTGRAATEADDATRALVARHGRPRRAAGGPARYSNVGYLVLAEVIAVASGRPFTDYVREAVLEPAGMTASGYLRPDADDRAVGYVRIPRLATPLLRAFLPPGLVGPPSGSFTALESFRVTGAGYGGLVGPATDAARLLQLHLADGLIDGHRVLQRDTARRMREIRRPGTPFDLGLGWFRRAADRDARPAFVEHWGTGGGFWNAMRLYPDLDLGIVVMANTTRPYEHAVLMDAVRTSFRS